MAFAKRDGKAQTDRIIQPQRLGTVVPRAVRLLAARPIAGLVSVAGSPSVSPSHIGEAKVRGVDH